MIQNNGRNKKNTASLWGIIGVIAIAFFSNGFPEWNEERGNSAWQENEETGVAQLSNFVITRIDDGTGDAARRYQITADAVNADSYANYPSQYELRFYDTPEAAQVQVLSENVTDGDLQYNVTDDGENPFAAAAQGMMPPGISYQICYVVEVGESVDELVCTFYDSAYNEQKISWNLAQIV